MPKTGRRIFGDGLGAPMMACLNPFPRVGKRCRSAGTISSDLSSPSARRSGRVRLAATSFSLIPPLLLTTQRHRQPNYRYHFLTGCQNHQTAVIRIAPLAVQTAVSLNFIIDALLRRGYRQIPPWGVFPDGYQSYSISFDRGVHGRWRR